MHARSATALAGAGVILASTFLGTAPAQAASPSCVSSVYYEGSSTGDVTLYPRVTCNGETLTLAIYTFNPETGEQSILYTNKPAGTYPGIGSTQAYHGSGDYCISVDIVWTWDILINESTASSRNCVTL